MYAEGNGYPLTGSRFEIRSEFTVERFDALAQELTARVTGFVPAATLHVVHESDAYCCASWQIRACGARELFVEQPGRAIAPFILRVGVYFQDSPFVTSQQPSQQVALDALTTHRAALQALGANCTFTKGSETRDDIVFDWSDQDLIKWLAKRSDNRDLVWRWDFSKGEPGVQQLEDILAALLPVWVVWNSL